MLLILTFFQYCNSAVVPFRDSIELVITPQDVKRTTDYVFWKVPAVKNNFKTTVKQKMLNMLLNRDLQDINPNPPFVSQDEIENDDDDTVFEEQNNSKNDNINNNNNQILGKVQHDRLSDTFQSVEINIKNPNGVVHSILQGPSPTEKKRAKLTINNSRIGSDKVEMAKFKVDEKEKSTDLPELSNEELNKFQNEHMGYLRPTKIKNAKHDFGEKFKKPPIIPNEGNKNDKAKKDDVDNDESGDEEDDEEDEVLDDIKDTKRGSVRKSITRGKVRTKAKGIFHDK